MAALLLVPKPKVSPNKTSDLKINAIDHDDPLKDMPSTKVLRMSNMVNDDDLVNDESYNELIEDILEECNSHGNVESIIIPRPIQPETTCPGMKQIFVLFANKEGAEKTKAAVTGRTFGGKPVVAYYYPESLFKKMTYEVTDDFLAGPDVVIDNNGCYSDESEVIKEMVDEIKVTETIDVVEEMD